MFLLLIPYLINLFHSFYWVISNLFCGGKMIRLATSILFFSLINNLLSSSNRNNIKPVVKYKTTNISLWQTDPNRTSSKKNHPQEFWHISLQNLYNTCLNWSTLWIYFSYLKVTLRGYQNLITLSCSSSVKISCQLTLDWQRCSHVSAVPT